MKNSQTPETRCQTGPFFVRICQVKGEIMVEEDVTEYKRDDFLEWIKRDVGNTTEDEESMSAGLKLGTWVLSEVVFELKKEIEKLKDHQLYLERTLNNFLIGEENLKQINEYALKYFDQKQVEEEINRTSTCELTDED